MDYDCRRKKGNCFHILTFHWEEGVEDCWFWQHKEGLKPFEGTKSTHSDTVKCSHSKGDHKLSLGGNQRWRFIWNPGFCGQIEGEWIRAGISDSSCILPHQIRFLQHDIAVGISNKHITSLSSLKLPVALVNFSQWYQDLRNGYPLYIKSLISPKHLPIFIFKVARIVINRKHSLWLLTWAACGVI